MDETLKAGAKFCENCGAPVQPGQKFCDNCGQKIVFTGAPAAAPVPAEEPQAGAFPEEPQAQAEAFPEEPQAGAFPEEPQVQAGAFPEEPQAQAGAFSEEPQAQAGAFSEVPQPQESAFQQNNYQQNSYQQNNYQQNSYQQSTQQGAGRPSSNAVLPPRLGCALAYLFPLIGCIALYFLGDREDDFVRHHLNQAIVLCILQMIRYVVRVDLIQTVLALFLFFGWIVGMYGSISGKKTEIPLISQVKII